VARADRVAGALLLILAVAYWRLSDAIEVGFASDLLGPRFFPRALAVLLGIAGALLVARTLLPRHVPAPVDAPAGERLDRLWAALAMTAAYIWLLPRVGFLPLTPVYLALFTLLLGYRRPLPLVATAVGVTVSLYVVFAEMLNVRLPAGLLAR
jgi:putative tricarboxylic transport membrane protein